MSDRKQTIIEKKFPYKSFDYEEELAKQQIMIKNSKRLILSEKAVEVFEIVKRYNLPMGKIVEILMEVLDVSRDSAKALVFRYREGCL